MMVLVTRELYPTTGQSPAVGVYSFQLEFPQGIPPSFVMGVADPADEPTLGLTYKIIAYFCAHPSLPLLE